MIKHIWSVLCRMASFDAQTNSVSLLSTIEAVTIMGDPSPTTPSILEAELVSLWSRDDSNQPVSGKMRAQFIDPTGKDSPPIVLEINLLQSMFHRTRINIGGIPIILKGLHSFTVELQEDNSDSWELVATIPLLVLTEKPNQVST